VTEVETSPLAVIASAVNETRFGYSLLELALDEQTSCFVRPSYMINDGHHKAYLDAKASPDQLQAELNRLRDNGIMPEAYDGSAINRFLAKHGIAIDCSDFVFHSLSAATRQLGIGNYEDHVRRSTLLTKRLLGSRWQPVDAMGRPRRLTNTEIATLESNRTLSVGWLASLLGKPPARLAGAAHIAAAAYVISPSNMRAGDIIALHRPNGSASHVAIISEAFHSGGVHTAGFWHSVDTGDPGSSGLRMDQLCVTDGPKGRTEWSHPCLEDSPSHPSHSIRRPTVLGRAVA
jgi:hypothetical protein